VHEAQSAAVFFAILPAILCASSVPAQRGGIAIASTAGSRHFARTHRGGRGFAGSVFLPPYDSDDDSPVRQLTAPEIVPMAVPAALAPLPKPPAESLIIEFEGDHWVRVTNGGQSQSTYAVAPEAVQPVAVRRAQAPEPAAQLPPAVLVFRDGHQEEITRYTIAGAVIVTRADYWTTGSWTRKIEIADLNVPETLRLSQQRGAQFKLPSGPNEVIVRP
jgi:hypothetical protein